MSLYDEMKQEKLQKAITAQNYVVDQLRVECMVEPKRLSETLPELIEVCTPLKSVFKDKICLYGCSAKLFISYW